MTKDVRNDKRDRTKMGDEGDEIWKRGKKDERR